ncbi:MULTISPECIES: hypothetical protein [unclassified Butyrivibrio]|uniref:hypothetical protein n=1 Tax=unclassified Butyrivibrio TaxID=2639466 RepID=UPI000410C111|nr:MULTISPECIES: hypothetical protein [unclassified Butyrivibrio]
MKETLSKKVTLILIIMLAMQIITICVFGVQKAGFHQDEYYSFFSTNRSLGFYYPDREWVDSETIRNEFVVLPGEGFNYGLVHIVQSWDVHPPLFYDMLHTICSISAGVFSKWQGILLNLIGFAISFLLLNKLARSIGMADGERLVLMFAYGFNPMTISCVLFIRMYMWLTVFVLAYALCHMRLISLIKRYYVGNEITGYVLSKPFDKQFKKGFVNIVLGIAVVSFLGFSTQYYFLIYMGMMSLSFGLWFLFMMPKKKKKKLDSSGMPEAPDRSPMNMSIGELLGDEEFTQQAASMAERFGYLLVYGCGCALALIGAVALYPASFSHIFRGYRGQEAQAAFTDSSNIWERFRFFVGLADDYLLSGFAWLVIAISVIALIGLFFFVRMKNKKDKLHIAHIRILVAATTGYFLIVAKTALLLGNTSNRYEMPIYPIILLLAVYFIKVGIRAIVGHRKLMEIGIPTLVTFLIFILITVKGLVIDRNVLFLYPEDASRIAYARQMNEAGAKAVVMYNDATPDNIWRITDELLEYDKLYYVNEADTEAISDAELTEADTVIVYAADHDNRDEILSIIESCNSKSEKSEKISAKDMWTVYELK